MKYCKRCYTTRKNPKYQIFVDFRGSHTGHQDPPLALTRAVRSYMWAKGAVHIVKLVGYPGCAAVVLPLVVACYVTHTGENTQR